MSKYEMIIGKNTFECEVDYKSEYIDELNTLTEDQLKDVIKKNLVFDFISQGEAGKKLVLDEFMEWLSDNEEVQKVLTKNTVSDADFDYMDKYFDTYIQEQIVLNPILD